MITKRIIQLTVPSIDNGTKFIRTERLDLIIKALKNSEYECLADLPLSKLYRHKKFKTNQPCLLLSCHIDSVYKIYFATVKKREIQGTFDNSACNAILVELMRRSRLPEQVLICFTGDEEDQMKGVEQTVKFMRENNIIQYLGLVITLDLTEEGFGSHHYTIENYFVRKKKNKMSVNFSRKRNIKRYLKTLSGTCVFVKNAEEDESCKYMKHDLNGFTYCLPCLLLGDHMHDDAGVAILRNSLKRYSNKLQNLTNAIIKDLFNKKH